MARNADLEKQIDRLYAVPPGEFVGRREELARSLRSEGKRESADEVKKLRKPTVAAWAVNQLVRREKMRVRGLFTAGERLRRAHEKLMEGGPSEGLERAHFLAVARPQGDVIELQVLAGRLAEQHRADAAIPDRQRLALPALIGIGGRTVVAQHHLRRRSVSRNNKREQ